MNIRKQQGFTIIEVVLVLAIAGLIFLMVFIALPTLQRNQRDTRCQLVATVPANTGEWRYVTGNVCGATEGTLTAASTRDYVIQMKLEGSGIACVDSKN